MTTATQVRKKFLDTGIADFLIEEQVKMVKGEITEFATENLRARDEAWGLIKDMISQADDPAPSIDLSQDDISDKVDAILTKVATGVITPAEGKKLIALLQAGFDLTELPKIVESLGTMDE